MSVAGYTSNWNRNWGPSSQSSWATTAAKFPPAESPPTAMRVGSISSSAAVHGSHTQRDTVPPGRTPADSHAGGIDLQLGRRRRLGHPAHGRHAVVDRRRERML